MCDELTSVRIRVPGSVRGHYEGFMSSGGASLVVVENANVKEGTIVMSVKTGFFDDPVEYCGLAHFCEHMLFNGSQCFPEEQEFSSYISSHRGKFNAFTSSMCTTFYSSVPESGFDGLVERFMPFFFCPTFNPNCVSREVIAVHNEDLIHHRLDDWRFKEVLESLSNPTHPSSRYGCGNKDTLMKNEVDGQKLAQLVREFYEKNYISSGMSLVVCSSRAIGDIVKLMRPYIAQLPVSPTIRSRSFEFLTSEENALPFRKWINFRSQKEEQVLKMFFEVISSSNDWKKSPEAYILYILNHKCRASILGILKEQGLATEVNSVARKLDDGRHTFCIVAALTISGLLAVEHVIETVFSSIGISIANGIDSQVYEDMKAGLQLDFESTSISSCTDHCIELSQVVLATELGYAFPLSYPIEDDFQLVERYIKQLTPDRCCFALSWGSLPLFSSEEEVEPSVEKLFSSLPLFAQVKADMTTRFSKACFGATDVPDAYLQKWSECLVPPFPKDLELPRKNVFLASDFTVYASDNPISCEKLGPIRKVPSTRGASYIRKDSGYHKTFTSTIAFSLLSSICYSCPSHRCYTLIMIQFLKNATDELRSFASLASLNNHLTANVYGPSITVSGPEEHLFTFFITLLEKILDHPLISGSEEMFNNYALVVTQSFRNFSCKPAYAIGMTKASNTFSLFAFDVKELLNAISDVSYSGYLKFVREYLTGGFLFECFVAGNLKSNEEVKTHVVDRIEHLLKDFPVGNPSGLQPHRDGFLVFPSPWPTIRSLSVDSSKVISHYNVLFFPAFLEGNKNVCVLLNLFAGRFTSRLWVLIECAKGLLSSSFFHAIRTQETLGYVVSVFSSVSGEGCHLCFVVESGLMNVDAQYILSRMTAYLSALETSLDSICTTEVIEGLLKALITKLQQLPLSVEEDCFEISRDYYHPLGFSRRERQLEATKDITSEDVKEFMRRVVFNKRECAGLAVVVDKWREEITTSPEWVAPGNHLMPISPAKNVSNQKEECIEINDKNLVLPDFASESCFLSLSVKASAQEYQRELHELRSFTPFRDVNE